MGESKRANTSQRTRATIAAITLLAGFASSASSASSAAARGGDKAPIPPPTATELDYARGLSRVFRSVAKRASTSVVAITATAPRGRGEGTGVIISTDGLIVTNHHVIAAGNELTVRLADGREFSAVPVGVDPETDLAVIRIGATDLTAATFGDSNALQPGDWVLAIGCPFGLEQTVTAGIVSAKGREGVGLSTYEEYIQTDAAINPGNSGGPLLDLDGKIVGINCGIASQSGGNMGVGFAIPSQVVTRITKSISKGESVRRGWLGVSMQELTTDLARSFGRSDSDGVLVTTVVSDTPADRAGLRSGDIIVTIDGEATRTPAQAMRRIANSGPTSRITLGLVREGESLTTTATLEERPPRDSKPTAPTPVTPEFEASLGLTVKALDSDTATALAVTGVGVFIESIRDAGPAQLGGLQVGDVVREVNGARVGDVESFRAALARSGRSRVVRIFFEREGTARFTMLRRNP